MHARELLQVYHPWQLRAEEHVMLRGFATVETPRATLPAANLMHAGNLQLPAAYEHADETESSCIPETRVLFSGSFSLWQLIHGRRTGSLFDYSPDSLSGQHVRSDCDWDIRRAYVSVSRM